MKSKKALFICGVPPVLSAGAGRMIAELIRETQTDGLEIEFFFTGNKSAVANYFRKRQFILFLNAALLHYLRRFRAWIYVFSGTFARTSFQLVLFHHQEIGNALCERLISQCQRPVWLFLFDSSFFCIKSYNHLEHTSEACLQCVNSDFQAAIQNGCKPFPILDRRALPFLRFLKSAVPKGQVKLLAQNERQAQLVKRHFQLPEAPKTVGVFTIDMQSELEDSLINFQKIGVKGRFDVVFHGSSQSAKGLYWAIELARCCPDLRFLFPLSAVTQAIPPNAEFIPLTWETGLKTEVETARCVLVPSLWSAPIESAFVKSLALAKCVAVVDEPSAYSSEYPETLIIKLSKNHEDASRTLSNALRDNWQPDPLLLKKWKSDFLSRNARLSVRILRAISN